MEGRKRKRRVSSSTGAANPSASAPSDRQHHPAPPPPPPQSLVDLLQSDASVLRYFASLQSNLEADVGAWRDKAQKYKREAVALRRRLDRTEKEGQQQRQNKNDESDSDGSDASIDAVRKRTNANARRTKEAERYDGTKSAKENGNKRNGDQSTSRKKKNDEASSAIAMADGYDGVDISQTMALDGHDTSMHICEVDRAAILSQLDEAYRCFERLGVSLVDESHAPANAPTAAPAADTGTRTDSGDNVGRDIIIDGNEPIQTDPVVPSLILTRRSDHDVAADLIRSLRSLVRVSTRISDSAASKNGDNGRDLARKYEPFPSRVTTDAADATGGDNSDTAAGSAINGEDIPLCLPCCHEILADQHPAADGLGLAIRALTIMDTFCGSMLGNSLWDKLFESKSCTDGSDGNGNGNSNDDAADGTTDDEIACRNMKLEHVRQGMRDRKGLVDSLVLSLRGEVTTRWAVEDRLARADVGALLFDDAEVNATKDDDDDDTDSGQAKAFGRSFDSRSYNRLSSLVDRVMYARILSAIYQHRSQYDTVVKVILSYVMSAMPSFGVEDYPQHSPVLSFCVLEGLMHSSHGKESSWLDLSKGGASITLAKTLHLCIHSTMKIWADRANSIDSRIRDVSRVELAAFNRITKKQGMSFLAIDKITALDQEGTLRQAGDISSEIIGHFDSTDAPTDEDFALPLLISLILIGDVRLVAEVSSNIHTILVGANGKERFVLSCMLLSCCQAFQAIRCRISGGSDADSSANNICTDLVSVLENLDAAERSNNEEESSMYLFILAQCSAVLADGIGTYNASQFIIEKSGSAETMGVFGSSSSIPMIRVINLERRSDRWNAIVGQARASQLLVVRGPASLLEPSESESNDKAYWGNYAFDGRGDIDFTSTRISLGDTSIRLNDYVATHWLPSELVAFDKNAKEEEVSVPASATERACALSHIASWKGVERSLRCVINQQGHTSPSNAVAQASASAGRMLRISGFASGPALLHENRAMDPVPVCVVMEDDAVLVDRFRDRLAALLLELPRDFHFCSLGYGRPKNAPMIEFSDSVGIPTFLWYMTGYILSLEGAKLLLDGLPVAGPVDSWVGLKISSNWENEYGYAIGVGRDARKSVQRKLHVTTGAGASAVSDNSVLAHKDLARLMKFRAFAALVPLCSQKVGHGNVAAGADASGGAGGSNSGTTAQTTSNQHRRTIAKWRDRDSDIVYSGVGK